MQFIGINDRSRRLGYNDIAKSFEKLILVFILVGITTIRSQGIAFMLKDTPVIYG
jgi:hypothetical protein